MSNLKNKSEINIESAQMLQDKCYYPSVIHCAYYSCVQYMKYIAINKLNKTNEQIEQERVAEGKGTHQYLINLFTLEFQSETREKKNTFKEIKNLKKLREKADYSDFGIGHEEGRDSISMAKTIVALLKGKF